ncbi:hypothetical protein A2U01_0050316, partial [Trifolium medium]|nr:hypothetical protein [Trifolium medium]
MAELSITPCAGDGGIGGIASHAMCSEWRNCQSRHVHVMAELR